MKREEKKANLDCQLPGRKFVAFSLPLTLFMTLTTATASIANCLHTVNRMLKKAIKFYLHFARYIKNVAFTAAYANFIHILCARKRRYSTYVQNIFPVIAMSYHHSKKKIIPNKKEVKLLAIYTEHVSRNVEILWSRAIIFRTNLYCIHLFKMQMKLIYFTQTSQFAYQSADSLPGTFRNKTVIDNATQHKIRVFFVNVKSFRLLLRRGISLNVLKANGTSFSEERFQIDRIV